MKQNRKIVKQIAEATGRPRRMVRRWLRLNRFPRASSVTRRNGVLHVQFNRRGITFGAGFNG